MKIPIYVFTDQNNGGLTETLYTEKSSILYKNFQSLCRLLYTKISDTLDNIEGREFLVIVSSEGDDNVKVSISNKVDAKIYLLETIKVEDLTRYKNHLRVPSKTANADYHKTLACLVYGVIFEVNKLGHEPDFIELVYDSKVLAVNSPVLRILIV